MNKKLNILVIVFLLFFVACAPIPNPSLKSTCIKSGGEYITGFGETSGTTYYCKCPQNSFRIKINECQKVNQKLINKCNLLSNEYTYCEHDKFNDFYDEAICNCNFKDYEFSTQIRYGNLNSCECNCYQEECICNCIR